MFSAALRPDEADTLAALRALEVLDTESEAPFDALVQAAAAVCGAPISLISLVDAERQWFKAKLGLPGVTETPRELAFCAHAVLGDELFEVPDALQDERFFDNPLVAAAPHIRFYAGMPVRIGHGGEKAALRGEPQIFERVVAGPGGRTRHSLANYLPDVVDGVVVGLLIEVNDVTSLKLAEDRASALQDERDRLAMVARLTSNAVLITDARRRITWVNAGFERITGYSADEALGRTPRELLGFEGTDPTTVERLMQAQQAGQAISCEILNRGKTGRVYWAAKELQPLHDAAGQIVGFMSIESDITARRAAEVDARRNGALLRGAIDAIDEAFVLYDPEDRLVFCNDKYRAIYAASADLIVPGATFESIVREGARRGQYKDAIGRTEAWVAERMVAHRAGNATLIQKIDSGRTLRIIERKMPDGHLVGFRIDITDLVRATEAAEEGNRAKSDFIATVSHELRTPLQSINGFSELGQHMAQGEGQERFATMFGKVLRAGQRMLSLVNDLLDLSAIDAATLAVALKPEDLRALADSVCEELAPQVRARELRLERAPSMPALPVHADAGRMQQVMRNVLANAIRFAPAGSVVVIDGIDLGHQGIEWTVRDHGPGIPPDELEKVFSPFVQSSRTRDGSGGSGLGLAICRRIMTAHGGSITAENAPGGGALLRLRLPAAASVADPGSSTHESGS